MTNSSSPGRWGGRSNNVEPLDWAGATTTSSCLAIGTCRRCSCWSWRCCTYGSETTTTQSTPSFSRPTSTSCRTLTSSGGSTVSVGSTGRGSWRHGRAAANRPHQHPGLRPLDGAVQGVDVAVERILGTVARIRDVL